MAEALHFCSVETLGRAFRSGEFSPLELTRALLARIERLDPGLNAFILCDANAALAAARAAGEELAGGRDRSPLHGVPVGIKDIINVAGLPTTCHPMILNGRGPAAADSAVVGRLRAQGTVVLGKLATHEFAIGGPSFDLPFPPARDPWNREHHPGGSSSGSGAVLAAGFFPAALGTDTGGSGRNPASCCGIVGLKPTYGLVSRRGVFPLAFTLDHVGPMTRTVADNALLLDAITAFDPEDPGSIPARRAAFGRDIGRGVHGQRIGFVRHFHEEDVPADPEVAAALEEAARVLQAEGAVVRQVRLPSLNEFGAVNRVIMSAEAWAMHAPWLRTRAGDYGALARRRLLAGAFLSAGDYVQAMQRRREMIAAVDGVFARWTCCWRRAIWIRRAASTMRRRSRAPIRARHARPST